MINLDTEKVAREVIQGIQRLAAEESNKKRAAEDMIKFYEGAIEGVKTLVAEMINRSKEADTLENGNKKRTRKNHKHKQSALTQINPTDGRDGRK